MGAQAANAPPSPDTPLPRFQITIKALMVKYPKRLLSLWYAVISGPLYQLLMSGLHLTAFGHKSLDCSRLVGQKFGKLGSACPIFCKCTCRYRYLSLVCRRCMDHYMYNYCNELSTWYWSWTGLDCGYDTIVYDYHTKSKNCKNKVVVLTTEWLPWLLTRWRNIGDEKFFGIRD